MRAERDDDVVLSIINEKDTIFWYRCGCGTRRLYREEFQGWDFGYVLCFDHKRQQENNFELWQFYLNGLMKIHMSAISK